MRPNVLVVVLDAARRDSLEPYGATPGSTPAIAQIAGRGRALPEVYATGCWTVPSHSSMFTGLLPRAAGLAQGSMPSVVRPVVESHRDRLLAEVLRRAGYSTRAASANLWVSEASGFATGFDQFVQVDTQRRARMDATTRRGRLRWQLEAVRGRVDDGATEIQAMLARWLSEPRDRPFFWFVNLVECHSPYLPPRPYGGLSASERLRAAEDARRYYTLGPIWSACAGVTEIPEETLGRMRRLYEGSIRYMDDWLGQLVERLDGAGVLDDTLVIVTSDHGENLGEDGLIAHAFSLDNRLIHVPLVLAGPGADAADINSLASLPRLVADAVALDDHPWTDAPPSGFGVAQFDPPAGPSDAALHGVRAEAHETLTTPLTCAVAGGVKLLRRGDREQVFDLAADPLEVKPRRVEAAGAGLADRVATLRAALEHPAVTSRRQAGAPAGDVPDSEVTELEERMRLLGYM